MGTKLIAYSAEDRGQMTEGFDCGLRIVNAPDRGQKTDDRGRIAIIAY